MYPFNNLINGSKRLGLLFPKRDLRLMCFAALAVALILVLFQAPSQWLEMRIIDFKSQLYARILYSEPSQDILVVAIDTQTLDKAPHNWPWPHSYWAEIIDSLTDHYQPEAIVVDVYFQAKKDTEQDPVQVFAQAIKKSSIVGLVSIFEQVILGTGMQIQLFPPEKNLRDAAAFWGLTQQRIDKDGRIRSFLLHDQRIGRYHIAWELQKFLQKPLPEKDTFAHMQSAESLIVFRHPARGFARVPLIEVVEKRLDPEILKDKTLVIGATAPVLHDFHDTVLGTISGPDIVCNTIQTVREDRLQFLVSSTFSRLIAVLIGLLLAIIIVADFSPAPFKLWIAALVILPFLLFAYAFYPLVYPPVGLVYIAFMLTSSSIFFLARLIILSEIQQSLHEAQICGQIQQKFFPAKELNHNSISINGHCVPYQNAGGDYYDFFKLKNGNIFFMLGDVSGHGISASMITTAAKSIVSLKTEVEDFSLVELFKEINTSIITMTKRKMMMTATAGVVDFEKKSVELISAGHLPAILNKQEGIEEFALPGFPLGITPKYRAKTKAFDLPETGFLVLYSDGIIEGANWEDEQYGFERFNAFIDSMPHDLSCDQSIEKLYHVLDTHIQGRPYEDDVTFLIVRFDKMKSED